MRRRLIGRAAVVAGLGLALMVPPNAQGLGVSLIQGIGASGGTSAHRFVDVTPIVPGLYRVWVYNGGCTEAVVVTALNFQHTGMSSASLGTNSPCGRVEMQWKATRPAPALNAPRHELSLRGLYYANYSLTSRYATATGTIGGHPVHDSTGLITRYQEVIVAA